MQKLPCSSTYSKLPKKPLFHGGSWHKARLEACLHFYVYSHYSNKDSVSHGTEKLIDLHNVFWLVPVIQQPYHYSYWSIAGIYYTCSASILKEEHLIFPPQNKRNLDIIHNITCTLQGKKHRLTQSAHTLLLVNGLSLLVKENSSQVL